ncbi:hypothetical protein ACOSQ2_031104 [Xanthoceras sorbifolium]|uniref:RING-type domain-containing protein n=1 Tax=Xanthoceras sorbifolium TaxID=99658 RepID=A0ABQ8H1R6_9ROSI|nr:hypothetical protein JRO89_XS15G0116400 [Xanthoceras sorbifolium]
MNMVPQITFVSLPPDVPLLFTFMTALGIMIVVLFCVMAVCMIATSFVTIIIYLICNYIYWPCFERCERGDIDHQLGRVLISQQSRVINHQAIVPNNKALRQQALEKLLPPLVFGSNKETLMSCGDCSICLDDYNDGDLCKLFPVCNHMFHLKCIDSWLNNHLTCPVCRKRLLDA